MYNIKKAGVRKKVSRLSKAGIFYSLLKAGLWTEAESKGFNQIENSKHVDWQNVYGIAQEQSVLGLVFGGLEQSDIKPRQVLLLQWIGELQVLEQQNLAMNRFIANLTLKMRSKRPNLGPSLIWLR